MFRFLVPAVLIAAPATAATGPFQDTAMLDRAVAGFTEHAIGDEGGARTEIDGRLKLAACPTVALSWRTVRHDAVVIACSGPAWRIFVPVQVSAQAPAAMAAGAAVAPHPQAKQLPVIKRGDPVMIEAGEAGFSISREGVAMGDAVVGGRFLVRADGTKAPIQAIAVEPGRATLPGGVE